jgi:hypothetical protein
VQQILDSTVVKLFCFSFNFHCFLENKLSIGNSVRDLSISGLKMWKSADRHAAARVVWVCWFESPTSDMVCPATWFDGGEDGILQCRFEMLEGSTSRLVRWNFMELEWKFGEWKMASAGRLIMLCWGGRQGNGCLLCTPNAAREIMAKNCPTIVLQNQQHAQHGSGAGHHTAWSSQVQVASRTFVARGRQLGSKNAACVLLRISHSLVNAANRMTLVAVCLPWSSEPGPGL